MRFSPRASSPLCRYRPRQDTFPATHVPSAAGSVNHGPGTGDGAPTHRISSFAEPDGSHPGYGTSAGSAWDPAAMKSAPPSVAGR